MCAFCVILGDTIPHVLLSILLALDITPGGFLLFLTGRNFVIAVLTMGVSWPLSLHREIEKLSGASAFALVRYVNVELLTLPYERY